MGLFDLFSPSSDPNAAAGANANNPLMDPRSMMLMGIAQGLLNASAPSPVRQPFMQILGQGAIGGMQGRMQALQNQMYNTELQSKQLGLKQQQLSYGSETNKTLGLVNLFRKKQGLAPLSLEDFLAGKNGTDTAASPAIAKPQQPDASAAAAAQIATTPAVPPPPPASPVPAPAQPQASAPSVFEDYYSKFLAPHEGGYTPSDGNGAPANFGINQKANPGVDVKNLTPDQAKQIAYTNYWQKSGADQLPPALAAIHMDTAFNMGPSVAQTMLAQSGGDPQKYLALRDQHYNEIAAKDPGKAKFLPTWMQRNNDLAGYASSLQGGGAPQPQAQGVPAGQQPDFNELASQIGMYDPATGEQMLEHAAENARTTLTPQQAQAMGFRPGAVVQQNPYGGMDVAQASDVTSPEAFKQQQELWGLRTGMNANGEIAGMDKNTVHYWGQVVRNGGQLPPLGMGPRAALLRQAILQDAASSDLAGGGSGAEHVATVATAKAGTQTLAGVTKLRAASESYENTMLQNINLAKQMMNKGAAQYGAPVINRWVQYIRKDYAGDPDVAAFNTAIQTVKNEYAKIQSGSLGNAPVTDAARREAEGMLDANQTPQQIQANFDYMVQETGNRLRALRAQEGALRSGLAGKSDQPSVPGVTEPQNQSAKGQKFVNGQVYQDAKGNKAKFQNGKWVPVQ